MFLKRSSRRKNGKEHHYWSLVENKRVSGGRVVQRHALYLGEINSSQEAAWRKTIDVLEAGQPKARTIALFPEERAPQAKDENIVGVRLHELELHRPRQWGACWLAGWRALPQARLGRVLAAAARSQSQGHAVGLGASNAGHLPVD